MVADDKEAEARGIIADWERAEPEAWLDVKLAGDPEAGLATLTEMLREGLSDAPLSTSQAVEDEAADR